MTPSPVIHVIDDDVSLRTALGRLLAASGYRVCGYESASAFLEADPGDGAGCILLDVHMPGLTGVQLQEHLAVRGCILPIVFLTGRADVATSVRVIKAGAEDYLLKPIAREALLDVIERSLRRWAVAAAAQAELSGLRQRHASLTAREQEVFALVIQGLMNKQIAYALGNSERTVKAQRQAVMEKLGADSVADLVTMGIKLGALKG
ncbi:response regulator transcription factor [Rugamonas apoptosis]|uniref:Response regulator transcription factor n=1 Tax=Rugamonas apoptosis TaxID=2758570 RepID=A0A7W2ILN1_9BURK|nr:response regulator [Rugamonas apoptosis]MBA5688636.1 response regulator transcription factor [Rugamonas apoptosis]